MSETIKHKLLKIDVESIWRELERDSVEPVHGERLFREYSNRVLDLYIAALNGKCSGWICAVLRPGAIVPLASRLQLPEMKPLSLPRHLALMLSQGADVRMLDTSELPSVLELFESGDQVIRVNLIGFGELYGMLFLHCRPPELFSQDDRVLVENSAEMLSRLMADENFSMRLTTLAAPLDIENGETPRKDVCSLIAKHACYGFGADAALLRLRSDDRNGQALEPLGVAGLIPDALLEPDSVGERVARLVLDSTEGLAVRNASRDAHFGFIGATIPSTDDEQLRLLGFPAFMVMRLQSDLRVGEHTSFGTLAILHQAPRSFARRDVGLFRTFCDRVADDLALLDQRAENKAMLGILKAQDQLGTRSEITALLGHDFGHKVMAVETRLVDFVDACKKALGERRLPESLQNSSDLLMKATADLRQIVQQLRLLGQGSDEKPSTFNVVDEERNGNIVRGVFHQIQETFALALERNNMQLVMKSEGNCRLFGVRNILVQALYNLILNSIDAQRASGRRRTNNISIQCRELPSSSQVRSVEFRIWDEGPGISRTVFPDESRIFDVGTTSKPMGIGTGTGLPVARSLLGKYFKTDLQLKDRAKALFQFTIAVQERKQ